MFDAEPVDVPAVCRIVFEGEDASDNCLVRLMIKDGNAIILFAHDGGVLAFGGEPTSRKSVRVMVAGADGQVVPAPGLCMVDAEKLEISCTALIGGIRLTVFATAGWSW